MSHPRWQQFKGHARRIADRGRVQWRRTYARLERMATPRRGPPTPRDPDAGEGMDVHPGGVAALRLPEFTRRQLTIAGIVVGVLVLIIAVLIAIWDWNWFKGPIERYASARTHRAVRIDGNLDARILTWQPEARVEGLKIGNPAWAGAGDTARIEKLTLKVKLLPLLIGRVEVPLVDVQKPDLRLVRDVEGRANWRFDTRQTDTPTRLPPIQQLIIRDGKIDFRDQKRQLTLTGTVHSSERLTSTGEGSFRLIGQGSLNRYPFDLRVTGGALVNVKRDEPYGFDARITAGATRITAKGQIDRPFDFGRYSAALTAQGRDMADLYYLTGLAFPNTPPYQTTGRFSRDGGVYRYDDFTGRVGSSDLSGDIKVSKPKDRNLLEATLVSRSLDIADLTAVVGGGPVISKAAAPEQKAAARAMRAQGRLLPDAPLNVDRLRAMDAKVSYRANSVQANRLRLTGVRIGANLDNALLELDPLTFSFSRGSLDGRVLVNGRGKVPATDADLRLRGYALETVIPARGGAAPITGVLEGRARLSGTGMSVRDTAAASSGTINLVVPNGEIRQAFAELMGINVGKGLYLLLSKDPRKTELNCAVAQFDVKGGVARARRIVVDTGVVVSTGSGVVNLADETLNLRLEGKSKKPRLLRLWAPITLKGRLAAPRPGVDTGKVVAQGGVAAALGALVSPLAAIVPFMDPGGAKGPDCAALVADARR